MLVEFFDRYNLMAILNESITDDRFRQTLIEWTNFKLEELHNEGLITIISLEDYPIFRDTVSGNIIRLYDYEAYEPGLLIN